MKKFITTDLHKRIKNYLINNPKLRDSDNKLMARVWYDEMQASKGLIETAEEFLVAVSNKQLTSWESATRCRRKIQENFPELKGRQHSLRQAKANRVNAEMKGKAPTAFQQGNIF